MKHRKFPDGSGVCQLWLSADDTYDWANNRPGEEWPCSTLSGKRVFAQFEDNGDLVDLTINGITGGRDGEVDGHELTAMTDDFIAMIIGKEKRNEQGNN